MKIKVELSYFTSFATEIELPEGKTWDDVQKYDVVKNDNAEMILSLKFQHDPEWYEFDLEEDQEAFEIDYRAPDRIAILDEDGYQLAQRPRHKKF